MKSRSALFGAVAGSLLLAGCATPLHHPANPQDPLEPLNRAVFNFNDAVDRTALKPAATAYKNVVPGVIQVGVNNFFGNLADVWTGINNLAQAKGQDGLNDLTRVAINSTFGIFGVLDIAVERNAYGRQNDSVILNAETAPPGGPMEMVFIRAPRIARVGTDVEVLARREHDPALVRCGGVLAATFHPELSEDRRVHQLFLEMVNAEAGSSSRRA